MANNENTNLRYWDYYNMTDTFTKLYSKSLKGEKFTELYEKIISRENILLAFRSIKSNTGSMTKGTDGLTIKYIKQLREETVIKNIRKKLYRYKPQSVKRVLIPKSNGKMRPLGIPTIWDRLIQQCFKQILEPICEAKFHPYSYGFRPLRSQENALQQCYTLINRGKMHYVVDVDIKGFFDNISHGKLLKQLWNLGIKDKRVISIISKMLKAEIDGEGIPQKGTPQGGILSPLLSNVVLNEFDWWISSQWYTFKSNHKYKDKTKMWTCLRRTTNLKEIKIVRYADDFKIFCKSHSDAKKIFKATKLWLKERLNLEVSEEKSKIVNLKKQNSEFLGFNISTTKVIDKNIGKKSAYVVRSHMTEKNKKLKIKEIKESFRHIAKFNEPRDIIKHNSKIIGIQNYYKFATHISLDIKDISHKVFFVFKHRVSKYTTKDPPANKISETYKRLYKNYNYSKYNYNGITLASIDGVKHKIPEPYYPDRNLFTEEGRRNLNKRCFDLKSLARYCMKNFIKDKSIEYNDNRISKIYVQNGLCRVTKMPLIIKGFDCHHIKPISKGGTDKFSNLVLIHKNVHKLIHARTDETIQKYKILYNEDELNQINKYRIKVGNEKV